MALVNQQIRTLVLPFVAPFALGVIAFVSSLYWGKSAAQGASPVTVAVWEAVLRDQGYSADRRNPGPLRQDELPNSEVWVWPTEGRIQIGTWTFHHAGRPKRATPPVTAPENIGSGWQGLTRWLELVSSSNVAISPVALRPKSRIWY